MQRGLEWRQVTIVLCELVDSVTLFERLGSVGFTQSIECYRLMCRDQVHSLDGVIGYFRGDSMLACFGYPIEHEDDPERGVRAALGIVAAIKGMALSNAPLSASGFTVRLGVDIGPAMIGHLQEHDDSKSLMFLQCSKSWPNRQL